MMGGRLGVCLLEMMGRTVFATPIPSITRQKVNFEVKVCEAEAQYRVSEEKVKGVPKMSLL